VENWVLGCPGGLLIYHGGFLFLHLVLLHGWLYGYIVYILIFGIMVFYHDGYDPQGVAVKMMGEAFLDKIFLPGEKLFELKCKKREKKNYKAWWVYCKGF